MDLIFFIFISINLPFSYQIEQVEVCSDNQPQKINCLGDTFIWIREALVGTFLNSNCSIEKSSCWANVTKELEDPCSGRNFCSLPKPDSMQTKLRNKSCYFKRHALKITYECIKYYTTSESCKGPLEVRESEGYLANSYTISSEKGSDACPWVFKTDSSKGLMLRTWIFSPSNLSFKYETCLILAKISSGDYENQLCAPYEKKNPLQRFFAKETSLAFRKSSKIIFVIHFQKFCPKFNIPNFTKLHSQEENLLVLQCLNSPFTLIYVSCFWGQWTEVSPSNCSIRTTTSNIEEFTDQASQASQTLLIIVVIAIAFIISLIIVILGLYCLKVHSNKHDPGPTELPPFLYNNKYSLEDIVSPENQHFHQNCCQGNYATTPLSLHSDYYHQLNHNQGFSGFATADRIFNNYYRRPTQQLLSYSNEATLNTPPSPVPTSQVYHELDLTKSIPVTLEN